jgi:hypothetical protein
MTSRSGVSGSDFWITKGAAEGAVAVASDIVEM